ncbi:D-alanyl-D-alanine carboxypeptidase [Mycetocola zhujimingii]|uniref:D-alanyl-D-alanine carboxypeptidase n=1 Tax=Mycetocola zhujimingii TaxID=2079792 RepID=A0A2U1TG88_9MICO|nr:D-alanyl-D-alanine carboxypeptidase [Mycetocola zhujimingii]
MGDSRPASLARRANRPPIDFLSVYQSRQPLSDRRVYLRRRLTVFGVLVLILGIIGYLAFAVLRPLPATAATLEPTETITQTVTQVAWPAYGNGAIGAVGFDGILSSHGAQESTPMASITKSVTALVVLEAMPLREGESGPQLTLTEDDQRIYTEVIAEGGSAAPVAVGSVFTERQLLEAMMLPSANNYSITLANWAYGSVDAFLAAATAWLGTHGFAGTHLADSSGINQDSRSTPADLVKIGELVLAHPVLSEIVSQQSADLPVIGPVTNTNKILGQGGIIGLKTGTTRVAGACLLFAAELAVGGETVTVVGVILGAPNHKELFSSVLGLLTTVEAGFRELPLVTEGESFGSYTTPWGSTSDIVATESASVLVWQDATVAVDVAASPLISGAAGLDVGEAVFTVADSVIDVPLELSDDLAEADTGWRITHPSD